jgi:hypothetical protein
VEVYAHPSLDSITSVNFDTILSNSMAEWNASPARNPYLDPGGFSSAITVGTFSPEDACTYGSTIVGAYLSSPYHIYSASIKINTHIQWNTTHTWDSDEAKAWNCKGDARKVMTHELGHAQGLGHTGISPAVMRSLSTTYWKPQPNDVQGLQHIYGAYP